MPYVALAAVCLFWGTTYLGIRVALESLPPLMLLAMGLGYLYERTGNLWATITVHCLFNTMQIAYFLAGSH